MGKQNGVHVGTVSENREDSYNGIPRVPLGNFLLILFLDKYPAPPMAEETALHGISWRPCRHAAY